MINNIYTIYDVIAQECGPLFEAKNDAIANRAVYHLIKSKGVRLEEHKLIHLGYINTEEAEITPSNIKTEVDLSYCMSLTEEDVENE